MELIKGRIESAQKVVIYGPEGIGKSTFASKFPKPLFIDTEGSTKQLDVVRTPNPTSWSMLVGQVKEVKADPTLCKTLIIDTADWAEDLAIAYVCASQGVQSLADFDYGKGYTYLEEEFGKLLNLLNDLIEIGIHVVFLAHAIVKQTELPEETGKYEYWTLKLERKTAPLLKEWADLVLFANYKTLLVEDSKTKTVKARGGQRYMYTSHRTTWDAKNRHDLPDELEFDFSKIAHVFKKDITPAISKPVEEPVQDPAPATESKPAPEQKEEPKPTEDKPAEDKPDKPEEKQEEQDIHAALGITKSEPWGSAFKIKDKWSPPAIPAGKEYLKPLYDLMVASKISDVQIRLVSSSRGFVPLEMPLEQYDEQLVKEGFVAAWDKVLGYITKQTKDEIPF